MSDSRWWTQWPGLATGVGLTTVGASILALGARRWQVRRLADPAAAATLVLAITGLIGHAYGASVLYGLNRWGGTAVPTAVALTSLAFGVIYADPSRGVAAVSLSDSAGGHLTVDSRPSHSWLPC